MGELLTVAPAQVRLSRPPRAEIRGSSRILPSNLRASPLVPDSRPSTFHSYQHNSRPARHFDSSRNLAQRGLEQRFGNHRAVPNRFGNLERALAQNSIRSAVLRDWDFNKHPWQNLDLNQPFRGDRTLTGNEILAKNKPTPETLIKKPKLVGDKSTEGPTLKDSQVYIDSLRYGLGRNDRGVVLDSLPELGVEMNRALEQAKRTVRILDKEKLTQTDPKPVELPASLDPVNDQQLIKTFESLLPALGKEMALQTVGKSVEQRVQALNPTQKLVLAKKIIEETEPEELLKDLTEDEKWQIEILVKKVIYERQIVVVGEVDDDAMRNRVKRIRQAWANKFANGKERVLGLELVADLGPQETDEIGSIVPTGKVSGSGDHFRQALMPLELSEDDFGLVMNIHENNPTGRWVEVEKIATRQMTDQEIYTDMYGQMNQLINFAKERAIAMLSRLL